MSIAFLDVDYRGAGARAACVVAPSWEAAAPDASYFCDIAAVEPYEPGSFYRRELPCLLAVLRGLPRMPDIVVVDGYVWLGDNRPGLGARLHDALGRNIPVVGVAKSAFAGAHDCARVVKVLRGASANPLFVTAIGMAPEAAAQCVRHMAGKHRIPDLLRAVDRLARSSAPAGTDAV